MHIQYSMSSTGEMRMLTSNNKFIKTTLRGEIALDFLFFFFLFSLNGFSAIVHLCKDRPPYAQNFFIPK